MNTLRMDIMYSLKRVKVLPRAVMTVRAVPKLSRHCKRIGGGKPEGLASGLQRAERLLSELLL